MSRRWPAGLVALFAVLALASTGQCKPPDLPKYQNVTVLPHPAEIATDPNLLKAIGVFNSYPIQILKVEDFIDPAAPCGEEISEVPVPEAIRRMPHEEPVASDNDKRATPSCRSFTLREVVESVKRAEVARQAMKKAHQRQQAGDYAGAGECIDQAREAVAGSFWGSWWAESLKRAKEAMHQKEELRKAQQYLLEKNPFEPEVFPSPTSEVPDGDAQDPFSQDHLVRQFIATWKVSGACGEAKPACGSQIVVKRRVIVVQTPDHAPGRVWIRRAMPQAGSATGTVQVEVRVGVSTSPRPPMLVRCAPARSPHHPITVNGTCAGVAAPPGAPKACCSMAAHLNHVPLITALDHLRAVTGCKVVIDGEGLQKAGVSPIEPVSLDVQGMPLYCVLDLMLRPHGLQARICGDTIHVTCTGERHVPVPADRADPAACEDACPKCTALHARAMQRREEAAKTMLVDGLLKACRLAVMDGRYARAADLARQAHAVDPARVEAEPMVIKLDLLGAPGAPKVRILTGTTLPANGAEESQENPEGQSRLVPHLPGVFADVVEALEVVERHEAPKR